MTGFTIDAARGLPGPEWLRVRRTAAAERVAAAGWPTPDEEIWRYSRIAELDLDRYAPGGGTTVVEAPAGLVAHLAELDPSTVAELDARADHTPAGDVFAELSVAFADDALVVRIPAGMVVAEPIVVERRVDRDGSATFPRLVVEAGADSECTVLERFSSADVTALVVPVTELRAAPAARLRYLAVNELGPKVWQIGHQMAIGDRDSTTLLSTVALGGDYARVRTESRLVGQGASARQIAVYFGEGDQMHDFRTLQDHVAPRTTSDLLFKGAVQGHARSVYTGLIRIGHDARGANAFQTNRNLKLSEGAWAESVPNLDIRTNEVKCSHASTVGPIDEEQRFYLESRGVPPAIAERLVVLGFFDEVLGQLPVADMAAPLRAQVAAKLDRRPD